MTPLDTRTTCGCGMVGTLQQVLNMHAEPGPEKQRCTIDQSKRQG